MSEARYNNTQPKSILAYAEQLLNKSLKDHFGDNISQLHKGKGKLGQLLEEAFFEYKPNSKSEPDFPEAGVELKTSPIKKTTKGFVSKERLVFNIINYMEEYRFNFRTSSFWRKNSLILLMFYLHEEGKLDIEYVFKIIRLWQFPAVDLKIIKDDWELIVEKIRAGKAHELSEGDTLYLGACTKGANASSQRMQPFSDEPAMQRAFSLKSKYLNYIIQKSLAKEPLIIDYEEYDRILGEVQAEEPYSSYQRVNFQDTEAVVKAIDDYRKGETFEALVRRKFQPFLGKSEAELLVLLNLPKSIAKNRFHVITREIVKGILGVSKNKIEEFEKADIEMKTIRLEKSGALKESMSFAQIKYKEIINEDWLDSYWYETLTRRFFFVVFQKDEHGELRLKKVMFWTMPASDLKVAEQFWLDTQAKIRNDDYENFYKIADDMICHVRPKGVDSKDLMETPSGRMEKKKCYWLNSSYIKKVIQ